MIENRVTIVMADPVIWKKTLIANTMFDGVHNFLVLEITTSVNVLPGITAKKYSAPNTHHTTKTSVNLGNIRVTYAEGNIMVLIWILTSW